MVLPQIKKGKIKKGDAQLKFKKYRNTGWLHTWVTIIVIAILVILTLVFVFSIVECFLFRQSKDWSELKKHFCILCI